MTTAHAESKRDARGLSLNFLGIVAQVALPAFHVQLARFLGAGGYGLYTWSSAFVDVFSVVTLFGCDQAVMRQVSLTHQTDRRAAAIVVGSALRVVLLSGCVVVVAMFFGAPVVGAFQHKAGLVAPLRCLALVPLFYHVATVFLVATQACGVMRWAFWARAIAQPLVLLLTTSVALRVGWGAPGAALAVAVGMAVTAALACLFYARELPLGPTLRAIVVGSVNRDMLRVAVPLVLANLLWALVGRIDAFFLGHYGNEGELGAYAACALYAAGISQVRGAFEPVTSALVAPALTRGDAKSLSVAIQRQTRWLAYVVFPMAAVLIGFGDPLLRLFGHGFTQGVPALCVLAVGHTANALALASFVLPLSGNARYTTWVAAFTLVLQGTLSMILVPRFGLLGAAIALSAGLVSAQTAQMILAARIARVWGLSRNLIAVLACAGFGIAMGRIVYHAIDASLVLRFALGITASAITYAISGWAFALTPEDRTLAVGAVRWLRVL